MSMWGMQVSDEFAMSPAVKRRGFSTIEAYAFVRQEFPNEKTWNCWDAHETGAQVEMKRFVGTDSSGQAGNWKWERIETSYPSMAYWVTDNPEKTNSTRWSGALKVWRTDGPEFILFSFLASNGSTGDFYMVSTDNWADVADFADSVQRHVAKTRNIVIERVCKRNLEIPVEAERVIFDEELRSDIESQIKLFFAKPELYAKADIPYRRGFMFVGPPGTGKTLMVRHLIRLCRSIADAHFYSVAIAKNVDDQDVEATFKLATHHAPSLIVIEDIDSLTTETQVSRAGFLAQLDGLAPSRGVVVIGTTNHPEKVDPALAHRPCRFDRIWKFDYPEPHLRLRYLKEIAGFKTSTACELANTTNGWSFAYLNELRVTAGLTALEVGRTTASAKDIRRAFDLIGAQQRSGKNGHEIIDPQASLGFAAA